MGLLPMKIAITGGTAGIGQALGNAYESWGHEVVRLSRRTGHNIRSIPKIADAIEPCDVFVNNAQAGFAQTELLFEMANRWTGTKKHIMVISTMMTQDPASPLPGLDMDAYRIQKVALEETVKQLHHQQLEIKFTLVRPGMVGTAPERPVPPAADVDVWANTLVHILEMADVNGLVIPDISLGPVFR
jgi:NADP-dependent 3-hydroxy acid dehydrogenase YdfG